MNNYVLFKCATRLLLQEEEAHCFEMGKKNPSDKAYWRGRRDACLWIESHLNDLLTPKWIQKTMDRIALSGPQEIERLNKLEE